MIKTSNLDFSPGQMSPNAIKRIVKTEVVYFNVCAVSQGAGFL